MTCLYHVAGFLTDPEVTQEAAGFTDARSNHLVFCCKCKSVNWQPYNDRAVSVIDVQRVNKIKVHQYRCGLSLAAEPRQCVVLNFDCTP